MGCLLVLEFLGKSLECGRIYVFEEMDRQHIRNIYEWCGEGILSGIAQRPYLAKKDLAAWYEQYCTGRGTVQNLTSWRNC